MSNDFETLNKILDGRYSCRAFQDKAVPIEDIHAIIQAAQKVPSWCNFQPWQVHLVRGDVRDTLSEKVMAAAIADEGAPDVPFPEKATGKHAERRRTCGLQLYQAVGVERGDRAGSRTQMLENYRFLAHPKRLSLPPRKSWGPMACWIAGPL